MFKFKALSHKVSASDSTGRDNEAKLIMSLFFNQTLKYQKRL